MIKEELIAALASDADLTKGEARRVLDALISRIVYEVSQGERVDIYGFGSFYAKKGRARAVRDFDKNTMIKLPPKMEPVFKPGKWLNDAANRLED